MEVKYLPILMLSGCSLMGNHEQASLGANIELHQTIECKSECKSDATFKGTRSQADTKKTVEGSM